MVSSIIQGSNLIRRSGIIGILLRPNRDHHHVAIGKFSEYRKEKASLGDDYMATCDYTESTIGYVQ